MTHLSVWLVHETLGLQHVLKHCLLPSGKWGWVDLQRVPRVHLFGRHSLWAQWALLLSNHAKDLVLRNAIITVPVYHLVKCIWKPDIKGSCCRLLSLSHLPCQHVGASIHHESSWLLSYLFWRRRLVLSNTWKQGWSQKSELFFVELSVWHHCKQEENILRERDTLLRLSV